MPADTSCYQALTNAVSQETFCIKDVPNVFCQCYDLHEMVMHMGIASQRYSKQHSVQQRELLFSSLVPEVCVAVLEAMHSYRSGAQAARQACLRAWSCQSMLYPSASFQLTHDRGIKLFEVTKAVAALNTECTASSPDGRDKKLLLNCHAAADFQQAGKSRTQT